LIDEGTVVRVKPNNSLRIRRTTELEQALKNLGCAITIETITPQARV
jgi:hypothetical protein